MRERLEDVLVALVVKVKVCGVSAECGQLCIVVLIHLFRHCLKGIVDALQAVAKVRDELNNMG